MLSIFSVKKIINHYYYTEKFGFVQIHTHTKKCVALLGVQWY